MGGVHCSIPSLIIWGMHASILMWFGCTQSHYRVFSSQVSSDIWVKGIYLENSVASECYSQAKGFLNRLARACPGLLLMRLNWSWCFFLTQKPVLFFGQIKTKLILVTARGETSKANLILIKPALFYSVSMRAGKQRWCSSQHWSFRSAVPMLCSGALFLPPAPASWNINHFNTVILITWILLMMYV